MGSCCETENDRRNEAIERQLLQDKRKLYKVKKILFLGNITYFEKSYFLWEKLLFMKKVAFFRKSNFYWEKLLFPQKLASSTLVNLPPDHFTEVSETKT